MPFTYSKLKIPEIVLITPKVFPDARGFFAELFKASDFKANKIPLEIKQMNQSRSQKNVLRGLHYQLKPKAQAKLVSVSRGEIFDVAVDIRKKSPTYGQWVAEHLSEENKKMMFVPEGFAHGFCSLTDEVEIIYYCSDEYAPDLERNILWNDPQINIVWPVKDPILSEKDAGGKPLSEATNNFEYEGFGPA